MTDSVYRHTQTGYLLIITYGVLILIAAGLVVVTGFSPVFAISIVVLSIALSTFYNLTVTVDSRFVVVEFYLGFPRRSFFLATVVSCRVVESPWYYGWGIRYTPRGWLFRVSGLSAVEIELTNGKHFQIGTDEPAKLAKAIEEVLEGKLSG